MSAVHTLKQYLRCHLLLVAADASRSTGTTWDIQEGCHCVLPSVVRRLGASLVMQDADPLRDEGHQVPGVL